MNAVHRRIVMRFIVSVAVLTALGVGDFAFLSAERTIAVPALAASPKVAPESPSIVTPSRHSSQFVQVDVVESQGASGSRTRVEQESQAAAPAGANSSLTNAPVQNGPAPVQIGPTPGGSTVPQCESPGGMGLVRIVEIDTTGGPGFGFQDFKQYDFLHDKEVVLTFDDGPWPSTPAVLKALTDECLKATFFEIGEHATWHPEITKQVIDAGMTVGTHTWSHKHLSRNPYAKHLEQAEQEVEMGNSAVHMAAAGGKIAPFFRFPALQQLPQLLPYLAERNIAVFSTDIDSHDFRMHKPDQVIKSVMSQLEKQGKGIILLHDLHRNTAEALPELIRQLKEGGYKVVHMVPKDDLTTLPKYDEMVTHPGKVSSNDTQPKNVVRTVRRLAARPELIDARYRTRTDPGRRSPHDHARKGVSPNQVLAAKHRGKVLPTRPLSAHGSPTSRHPRG
jgi:peptidoglycan/xylan/chitin deacetylase (PgdA/CDA1 family)